MFYYVLLICKSGPSSWRVRAFNNWGKAPSSRESRLLEPWHLTMFSTKILTQVSTVNWMILTGIT